MAYYLGLTGGIATGKSAATAIFKSLKLPVIDADQLAHQVLSENQTVITKIRHAFGPQVITNQQVNRQELGKVVFEQPAALAQLNQITAPVIRQAIISQMKIFKTAPVVVMDIPLLYEQHYEHLCSGVAVVVVDEPTQIKRLMARNQLSKAEAQKRIKSQMALSDKKSRADFILDNQGDLVALAQQIEQLLQKITQ